MKFVRPPINEIGLSFVFNGTGAISEYEIREIHQLFEADFPQYEIVPAAPGNDALLMAGLPPLNFDSSLRRWWLKSDDGAWVIQLQGNMLGLNWRRRGDLTAPADYPGFDHVFAKFQAFISAISSWHDGRGTSLPALVACEIFYDDIVTGLSDGQVDISQILAFVAPSARKVQTAGWATTWIEPVPDEITPEGTMRFNANVAAVVPVNGEQGPINVVRLQFNASGNAGTLDEGFAKIRLLHAHIRQRFNEITTDEIRGSWELN